MATTIGEIRKMHDRLPVLQAQESLREEEVARVAAHTDADGRKSWRDHLIALIRGILPRTVDGRPESHATIRERKRAEWEARDGAPV